MGNFVTNDPDFMMFFFLSLKCLFRKAMGFAVEKKIYTFFGFKFKQLLIFSENTTKKFLHTFILLKFTSYYFSSRVSHNVM